MVQENHVTVKLDSSVAPRGMKTYSESKIELRNFTNLEENAGKIETEQTEQPSELSSLEVAFDIAGVEKVSSENWQLQSVLEVVKF